MTYDLIKHEYDETIAAEVCANIATGESVFSACSLAGIGKDTFYKWLCEKAELQDKLARAREASADCQVDKALALFEKEPERIDKTGGIDSAYVGFISKEADFRKWLASKYNAKLYGDSTTLKGDKDNPLFNFATALDTAKEKLRQHEQSKMIDVTPVKADDDYSLV